MTIALIDANAFYVSCELLFQPWLRGRAAVAASNNDGCVVSRNDEAKRLGIKMGTPVFELRELVRRGEVTVFSSNYELYQSLSNRVMAILQEQAPRVFVYSIDKSKLYSAGTQTTRCCPWTFLRLRGASNGDVRAHSFRTPLPGA